MSEVEITPSACGCGCGQEVKHGVRFAHGHWSRTAEAKALFATRRMTREPVNPSGLCQCGCGQRTSIAAFTNRRRNQYFGEPMRYLQGHAPRPKAESAWRWRGGRTTHRSGYVYRLAPNHPHANGKGYIYEHRAVMEEHLGRVLDPRERVHHINHDRGDNRIENLQLFASQSEHLRAEHQNDLLRWRADNPERAAESCSLGGRTTRARHTATPDSRSTPAD